MAKIKRLLEVLTGRSGARVPSKFSSKILRCPLNCLYQLEIECAASVDPVDVVNDVSPQKTNEDVQLLRDTEPQSRPKRAAVYCTNQFLKTEASQLRET